MLGLFGNLSPFELLVIAIVAVLVFGGRLPEVAGRTFAEMRRWRGKLEDFNRLLRGDAGHLTAWARGLDAPPAGCAYLNFTTLPMELFTVCNILPDRRLANYRGHRLHTVCRRWRW